LTSRYFRSPGYVQQNHLNGHGHGPHHLGQQLFGHHRIFTPGLPIDPGHVARPASGGVVVNVLPSITHWQLVVKGFGIGRAELLNLLVVAIFLARLFLGSSIRANAIAAAVIGLGGVALLLLTPNGALDNIGLMAGVGGAVSMACGTVLSKRWMSATGEKQVSPLTFTAWQLIAGGLLLLPAAMLLEPALPSLSTSNILGFAYLGLIGAGLTYLLWFNGLAKLSPAMIAPLGFLSPVTAVLIGWLALNQSLTPLQFVGAGIVLFSVWLSQRSASEKNKFQIDEINSKQFT